MSNEKFFFINFILYINELFITLYHKTFYLSMSIPLMDLSYLPLIISWGSITFPIDLDIFLPFSSTTKPWTNKDLNFSVWVNIKLEKIYRTNYFIT